MAVSARTVVTIANTIAAGAQLSMRLICRLPGEYQHGPEDQQHGDDDKARASRQAGQGLQPCERT
jgi:hypothetical protein